MTLEDAKKRALDALTKSGAPDLAVKESATRTKKYGWVFFCNSRRYVETGDPKEQIVGVGPVVVLHDGSAHILPSGPPDRMIADFERTRKLEP